MSDATTPGAALSTAERTRILAQPFTYLMRGGKVRAFASADGAAVLKTLNTPAGIIGWYAEDGLTLTEVAWARGLGATEAAIAERIYVAGLASYRLAADELAAETGLLALYPNGVAGAVVQVTDEDGTVVTLDLAAAPFILQHRVTLVRAVIDNRLQTGDMAGCRRALDDVIDLILAIWRKGITDDTFNFHNNCGYADGRMIQIDIGELIAGRDAVLTRARAQKVLHKKSFAWLSARDRRLADYFADQVRARLTVAAIERQWADEAAQTRY